MQMLWGRNQEPSSTRPLLRAIFRKIIILSLFLLFFYFIYIILILILIIYIKCFRSSSVLSCRYSERWLLGTMFQPQRVLATRCVLVACVLMNLATSNTTASPVFGPAVNNTNGNTAGTSSTAAAVIDWPSTTAAAAVDLLMAGPVNHK